MGWERTSSVRSDKTHGAAGAPLAYIFVLAVCQADAEKPAVASFLENFWDGLSQLLQETKGPYQRFVRAVVVTSDGPVFDGLPTASATSLPGLILAKRRFQTFHHPAYLAVDALTIITKHNELNQSRGYHPYRPFLVLVAGDTTKYSDTEAAAFVNSASRQLRVVGVNAAESMREQKYVDSLFARLKLDRSLQLRPTAPFRDILGRDIMQYVTE